MNQTSAKVSRWDAAAGSAGDLVFDFDHQHDVPPRQLAGLLGGKGAGLAEMTSVLRMPVPPGFTLAVPLCRGYQDQGWPSGLDEVIAQHCAGLERATGRGFGDRADPLLLAVRSGAAQSMPGMLDTVLNLGLNDETVLGLAETSGDEVFAWDSYRRFMHLYAVTVLGVDPGRLPAADAGEGQRGAGQTRDAIAAAGRRLPEDPVEQLRGAIHAVLRSWDSERARVYRAREGIADDLGTAVNVQAMVFGNRRDGASGTGVVFSRNPSTGEAEPYGDFLPQAQGEDVVSGTARTLTINSMAESMPEAHEELRRHLTRLESHYRDLCDVEFTIESGRLWILQTRVGKRSPVAAVRAAVEMVDDPRIRLTPAEALRRVPPPTRRRAREDALKSARSQEEQGARNLPSPVAVGLGASPGRICGTVVLSCEEASAADPAGGPLILVRPETSPEDVPAMSLSGGLLTCTGGLVSHAAVVARGWGIPAVVGARTLRIGTDAVTSADGDRLFGAGDKITIDGWSGEVWTGALEDREPGDRSDEQLLDAELPTLRKLEQWAADLMDR